MNNTTIQLLDSLRELTHTVITDKLGFRWHQVTLKKSDYKGHEDDIAALFAHGVAKDRRENDDELSFLLLLGKAHFLEMNYSGLIKYDGVIKQSPFYKDRESAKRWIVANRENALERCVIKTRVVQFFDEGFYGPGT